MCEGTSCACHAVPWAPYPNQVRSYPYEVQFYPTYSVNWEYLGAKDKEEKLAEDRMEKIEGRLEMLEESDRFQDKSIDALEDKIRALAAHLNVKISHRPEFVVEDVDDDSEKEGDGPF